MRESRSSVVLESLGLSIQFLTTNLLNFTNLARVDAIGAGQNLQNEQNFSYVDHWGVSVEFGVFFLGIMVPGFVAFPDNLLTHNW